MSKFKDIIGQEQIREHLENAIRLGKVSHAYIINGERSSGWFPVFACLQE